MVILGFVIGSLILILGLVYIPYRKFNRHYQSLLNHKTKQKIKINKSTISAVIFKSNYEKNPRLMIVCLILLIGTILKPINEGTFLYETYFILLWIIAGVLTIAVISIIIKQHKILSEDYYYLEDEITHEQTDAAGVDHEVYVHFKKCVVPTEVPLFIGDAIKQDDEVYILVIGKKLYVFNKNYFELEETSKLKEQYIIEENIEGNK